MFDREKYGKIFVPMVTPFAEDQSVDYDAAVSVAEKLIGESKADSIILSGTTGEFFFMRHEERVKLFEVMIGGVGDRVPLIAGTGATSTVESVELSKKAEAMGYELLMVISPYFTKPTQSELYDHFRSVAEEVNIELMLYNIPLFTGVNIDPETLAKLAEVENIVGIKEETELNPKQITDYINATPDDFFIYNGDDTMILEAYAQGGPGRIGGVVSGASHLIGGEIREMINAFLEGEVQRAAEKQQSFLPLYRILGQNGRINPAALLKGAMNMTGYNTGVPRRPLSPGTPEEKNNILRMLENLDIIQR